MNKVKFYTIFCILNILLTIFIAGGILGALFLMFYNFFATSDTEFFSGLIFYIICFILKLRLPKILIILADKYKDSFISKFVDFIHNNPQQKKFILPIAFCFDLPFIFYWITLHNDYSVFFWVSLTYFLFYAGGVLFFYIMVYRELDIKDGKIKTFF